MAKKEQPLTNIGVLKVNLFNHIINLYLYSPSGNYIASKPTLKNAISSDLFTSIENKDKELCQEADLLNEKIKTFNADLRDSKVIVVGNNEKYVSTGVKIPTTRYYYGPDNGIKYINFAKKIRDADLMDKIDDLKIIRGSVCVKEELASIDAKRIQNLKQQRQTLAEERRVLARKVTVAKTSFKNKICKEISDKIDKAKIDEASKFLKKHGYKVMEKK